MPDWNSTSVSSPYATLVADLLARDADLATMFDGSTSTNIPSGSKRWSSPNNRFEQWGGVSWAAMIIGITGGGTGASDAAGARTNLGLGAVSVESILPIVKGGTGGTDVASARANLGLGAVSVESILPVTKGGTGGNSQATGRSGLGITATGDSIVTAISTSAARTALGISAAVDPVLIAANLGAARSAFGISSAMDPVITAASLAAARTAMGLGTLATLSMVTASELAVGSVTPAACSSAVLTYDIPFAAGMGFDFNGQNLSIQTFAEIVLARNVTFQGEVGYIDVPSGGAAVIVDVLKNGTTIYSAKPQFAAGANTLTTGTMSTASASSGDRITFRVTQIGSTTAGQKLRFTLKGQVT